MHKNKNLRKGISFFLSFFLAVSFFLLSAGLVIKSSYLPGNVWNSYLTHSGYGEEMAEAAYGKMDAIFLERGMHTEKIGEPLTKQALSTEFGYCVDNIWQGKQQEISRRKVFEKSLKKKITEYLQEAAMTEQLEEEVKSLVREAGDIYDRYLNPGWLAAMMAFADKFGGMLTSILMIAAGAGILSILTLWFLYHYKHQAVRYMCYSAWTSFLWSFLVLLYFRNLNWIDQTGVEPESYRRLMQGFWQKGMQGMFLTLIIELLIAILLLLWMKHLKHTIR